MKFDEAKAFPHPVLRPRSSDYEKVEFEVDVEVERIEGTVALRVTADYRLSDPDLVALVEKRSARYALLIHCPLTSLRTLAYSFEPRIVEEFPDGTIARDLEVTAFCVAGRPLRAFRARRWHSDFDGRTFDIEEGAVLAMDTPEAYWIDTADESHVGSIFILIPHPEQTRGLWSCAPTGDRVEVQMHPVDYKDFRQARERVRTKAEASYLMNGVYLPALVHLLTIADSAPDEYRSCRWYSVLNTRLEKVRPTSEELGESRSPVCRPIGCENADRLMDAQRVLEGPFRGLPLLKDGRSA